MTSAGGPAGFSAAEVKACCAVAYEGDWARLLLGDSFHPGGIALTLRLGKLMGLGPSSVVLDVASGVGTSAVALATRYGCRVVGVDLSDANIAAARTAAAAARVEHLVAFRVGDAEHLAEATAAFDAVICECALCTFPDKEAAAREFARVIRPGGVVGISDLTRSGALPPELDSLLGWVSCVADARSPQEYIAHLEGAGLAIERHETHDDALRDLVRGVRLTLLGAKVAAKLGKLDLSESDIETALRLSAAALTAVEVGTLGYALLVSRAPVMEQSRGVEAPRSPVPSLDVP